MSQSKSEPSRLEQLELAAKAFQGLATAHMEAMAMLSKAGLYDMASAHKEHATKWTNIAWVQIAAMAKEAARLM